MSLIGLGLVCTVLAGCAGSGSPEPPAAIGLTRDYIDALNSHDGDAACSLMDPQLQELMVRARPTLDSQSCAHSMDAYFGYEEDAGLPPPVQRIRAANLTARRSGGFIAVTAAIKLDLEDSPPADYRDVFWWRDEAEGLRLVKPGLTEPHATGAIHIPTTWTMRPLIPTDVQPIQSHDRPPCEPKVDVRKTPDPTGDASLPALPDPAQTSTTAPPPQEPDVTGITTGRDSRSLCVVTELANLPRPGLEVTAASSFYSQRRYSPWEVIYPSFARGEVRAKGEVQAGFTGAGDGRLLGGRPTPQMSLNGPRITMRIPLTRKQASGKAFDAQVTVSDVTGAEPLLGAGHPPFRDDARKVSTLLSAAPALSVGAENGARPNAVTGASAATARLGKCLEREGFGSITPTTLSFGRMRLHGVAVIAADGTSHYFIVPLQTAAAARSARASLRASDALTINATIAPDRTTVIAALPGLSAPASGVAGRCAGR